MTVGPSVERRPVTRRVTRADVVQAGDEHAEPAHGFVAEDSPFNLCIKIYDPSLDPDWVRENWYFSIGDTDVF